ncbi:TPA: transposase [Stenotrophomonas maltophilia]
MTPDELRNRLRTLDLNDEDRAFILELFFEGAGRKVGAYALDNVIVAHYSKKCRDVRYLESHTVEQTFAFQLELDPDVVAYICQVTCRGVRRGRHVSNAHADFLVIRRQSVEVVECKPASKLEKLIQAKPNEWIVEDGLYRNLAYEAWAEAHGVTYRVWTSPRVNGTHHRNLQFMVHHWDEELSLIRREGFNDVQKQLLTGPKSIAFLMERIAWFNAGVAAGLMADRLVYGPVEYVPITDTHHFLLTLSEEQADEIAAEVAGGVSSLFLDATGPVSLASASDVARGTTLLARLDRIEKNGEQVPRWLRDVAKRVKKARAEGRNPLNETVTNFARCGNRQSRLTVEQTELVTVVIQTFWLKGLAKSIADLHRELAKRCEKAGVQTPGRRALESRVKNTSKATRDLSVGGKRLYQANRPRSDPRFRAGTALAVHSVLHLDATKVDHRSFIQGTEGLDKDCPLLYTGRDEASGSVMAHAFVFGPARRDGPMILIRNYVRKYGCAPHSIVTDRGSDLKAGLSEIALAYGISILTVPTGGGRFNSEVETIQGQINAMVSHRMDGSTKPDQAGRSVDGRMKSRSTARMEFSTTEAEIDELLYTNLPDNPIRSSFSAKERMEHLLEVAPTSGIPVAFDDDFRFRTSVKLDSTKYEATRGLRFCQRNYTNADLSANLQYETILEARRDPEDTTFIWIQTDRRRYKAWCSLLSEIGHYSSEERYFETMWDQLTRPEVKIRKEKAQRNAYERTSAANEAQRTRDSISAKNEPKARSKKSGAESIKKAMTLNVDFSKVPDLLVREGADDN